MKASELISHLQKLDPETEVFPLWEQHCPGDFGGFLSGSSEDLWWRFKEPKSQIIFLDCENDISDNASWDVPE